MGSSCHFVAIFRPIHYTISFFVSIKKSHFTLQKLLGFSGLFLTGNVSSNEIFWAKNNTSPIVIWLWSQTPEKFLSKEA
jgi:hypothetical protein